MPESHQAATHTRSAAEAAAAQAIITSCAEKKSSGRVFCFQIKSTYRFEAKGREEAKKKQAFHSHSHARSQHDIQYRESLLVCIDCGR